MAEESGANAGRTAWEAGIQASTGPVSRGAKTELGSRLVTATETAEL